MGGGVGRNHIAEGYRKHADKFRIQVLCDVDQARLAAVGEEFSIQRRTRSFGEVLRMDDVDIVDICTPAALHFGQILGALAAGKEVVCEEAVGRLTLRGGQGDRRRGAGAGARDAGLSVPLW